MSARVSVSVLCLSVLFVVGCGEPMDNAVDDQAQGTQSQHLLTIQIDSEAAQFAADQPALIRISYTNTSDQPIRILSWAVPSQDLWVDMFSVSLQGVEVPYIGRIYKRKAASESDTIELQVGETISGVVDISRLYDFAMTGDYDIRVQVDSIRLFGDSANAEELVSNWIQLDIEGRQNDVTDVQIDTYYGGVSFSSCSTSRKSTLRSALSKAESYSVSAYYYLRDNGNSSRYRIWFGDYTSTRYNKAKTTMYNIAYRISYNTVKFYCDCSDDAFAYVYPTQPYKIHICSAFWSAPLSGTNSKGGTVVHEMSHFNTVGATQDYVYGVSDAKWIADDYPNYAVKNADNYEYFCERPNG